MTQNKMTLVDEHNYEWLAQYSWCAHYNPLVKGYYAEAWVDGRRVSMARLVLGLTDDDPRVADHIGHHPDSTLDNREDNLRPTDHIHNALNRKKYSNNKTGYKGVSEDREYREIRYAAQLRYRNKNKKIGRYKTAIEAARAYDREAIKVHGEFAHTNFPLSDYTKENQ